MFETETTLLINSIPLHHRDIYKHYSKIYSLYFLLFALFMACDPTFKGQHRRDSKFFFSCHPSTYVFCSIIVKFELDLPNFLRLQGKLKPNADSPHNFLSGS